MRKVVMMNSMKIKKMIKPMLLFIFIDLAVFASGCTEKNLTAEDIATQMLEKQDSIQDYSYTMHSTYYTGEKTIETEFKTIYKKPHMIKNFIQEPGKEEETLVLSDGEFRWTYIPGTNTVMKTKLPKTPELTKSDYMTLIGISLNDSNVSLLGVEEIDNRETYLLKASPKETVESAAQYYAKVWVDKETWMPLKYEMYDSSGNRTAKTEIWDFKVNSGIPDSEFVFNIPEGAEIKTTG
jgi:outer membrane lipoprotein-sorting protein